MPDYAYYASPMDFEEGEIADASDSELEFSPTPQNHRSSSKSTHSKHSKHHSKEKHEKRGHRKSKRGKHASSKANGRSESHSDSFNKPNRRSDRTEQDESLDSPEQNRKESYEDFSKGRRKRRRMERFSKPPMQAKCRYFMEGRCNKGDSCPFAHDFQPEKKQELCKFYAVGVCSKGSACLYLHEEVPCKFFHLYGKCGHGNSCKFSHAPLTPESQILLDRISGSKEPPSRNDGCESESWPMRGDSCAVEHGDVDYRFGHRPPQFSIPSEGPPHEARIRPMMVHNPHPRGILPPNRYESRDLLGPRPPFPPHPADMHERPRFFSDGFPMAGPRPFRGPNYPPNNFNAPVVLDNNYPPLSPGFAPMEFAHPMRHPQNLPTEAPFPVEGPRFRQPFHPPHIPPIPPAPFNPEIRLKTEAIMSSELDKMAALLASSKPAVAATTLNSPPLDPRVQSPGYATKVDAPITTLDTMKSPLLPESLRTSETSVGSQPRTSLPFSSPELNDVPSGPNVPTSPTPVQWRLIPLNMNVKIPYPLMQLPTDLPHRHEDPRLRGQLTALRPPPKQTPVSEINEEPELNILGFKTTSVDESRSSEDDTNTPVSRRPVKLQLNEMASTFANCHSASVASSTKSGDRSYLDDPRFRRRRIVTANNPSQPQLTQTSVLTNPTESVPQEAT